MRTLISHLGLGDSILLSGAAVAMARRYGELRVPAYTQYLESVKSFYVNHPEITVYPVENPLGSTFGVPRIDRFTIKGDPILCGFYTGEGQRPDISFPEAFYQQLKVDYKERWDSCPIAAAAKLVPWVRVPGPPHAFVHDDHMRGFKIRDEKGPCYDEFPDGCIVRPVNDGRSILRYCPSIKTAIEVHVIDSAFYHLTESLNPTGRLVLHRYARYFFGRWHTYPTRHKWVILE